MIESLSSELEFDTASQYGIFFLIFFSFHLLHFCFFVHSFFCSFLGFTTSHLNWLGNATKLYLTISLPPHDESSSSSSFSPLQTNFNNLLKSHSIRATGVWKISLENWKISLEIIIFSIKIVRNWRKWEYLECRIH